MSDSHSLKPHYAVLFEQFEENFLKVIWSYGIQSYRAYLIEKGDVEYISGQIRNALRDLVTNALARDQAYFTGDYKLVRAKIRETREILHRLTASCSMLHVVLFTPAPNRHYNIDQEYVDKIKDRIMKEREPRSICFLIRNGMYVPWGLVFDGPAVRPQKPMRPDEFNGFWCLRHKVATVFDTIADAASDFVVEYDHTEFRLLAAGDEAELKKAGAFLEQLDTGERELVAKLLRDPHPLVTSSKELFEAWKQNEKQLGSLYLFGHASARTMGFSPDDTMDVTVFKALIRKSGDSPRCLVFVNGCYTSHPDKHGTFLEATARKGFCGYIGAETEVPGLFAFRFGLAFLKLLYEGLEVVEIMTRLRRQHWPLGLIYGLYGSPHLNVRPDPVIAALPLKPVNYSYERLRVSESL